MSENGWILSALYNYHKLDTSKLLLGLASLLVVINSLSSFQIYAMPVFDNLEFRYTSKWRRPCPRWLRTGIRVFFGCLAFFIAVALPFLPSLAGLIGGIALPITLAYPCLMWLIIKKPQIFSPSWCLNWALGVLGMVLSVLVTTGAIWGIVTKGIQLRFFKPQWATAARLEMSRIETDQQALDLLNPMPTQWKSHHIKHVQHLWMVL